MEGSEKSSATGQVIRLSASSEEADQIQRSVKKNKQDDFNDTQLSEDQVMEEQAVWTKTSFAQVVHGE